MFAFKLQVTTGMNTPGYLPGTVADALCLVNAPDAERARDRALFELHALNCESCTVLDVMQLAGPPNPATSSEAMQQAYGNAARQGASVILYPSVPAAT